MILLATLGDFILWACLSLSWAVNPYEGLLTARLWFAGGLLAVSVFVIVRRQGDAAVQTILLACLLSGALIGVIGLAQWAGVAHHTFFAQQVAPSATMANRAISTEFAILCLGGLIPYSKIKTSQGRCLLVRLCAISIVCYCLVSGCKAAWLGLFAFAVTFLFLSRPWFKHTKPAVLALCLSALLIVATNQNRFVFIQDTKVQDSTYALRLALWANTTAMIADYPAIGVGLENWQAHYPKYHQAVIRDTYFGQVNQPSRAHNDLLEIWAELGSVGMVLFLLVASALVGCSALLLKDHPQAVGIMSGIIGLAACASVGFAFKIGPVVLVLACYMGIISALFHTQMAKDGAHGSPRNCLLAIYGRRAPEA